MRETEKKKKGMAHIERERERAIMNTGLCLSICVNEIEKNGL